MSYEIKKPFTYYECDWCGTYQFVAPPKPCRYKSCGSRSFTKHVESKSDSLFVR